MPRIPTVVGPLAYTYRPWRISPTFTQKILAIMREILAKLVSTIFTDQQKVKSTCQRYDNKYQQVKKVFLTLQSIRGYSNKMTETRVVAYTC